MVNVAEIYLHLLYKEGGRYALKHPPPLIHYSTTTAARLAISRTFFASFARRWIHSAWIITLRFAATIRANNFVRIYFHQFFKTFLALRAFILQKRHTRPPSHFLYAYYTPIYLFLQLFLLPNYAIKWLYLAKNFQKSHARPPPLSQNNQLNVLALPCRIYYVRNTFLNQK